jgi:hypothetical protein
VSRKQQGQLEPIGFEGALAKNFAASFCDSSNVHYAEGNKPCPCD